MFASILSTVEFYLLLINKNKSNFNLLSKISYKINAVLVFILSFLLFIYRLFSYDIVKYNSLTNNSTDNDLYYLYNSQFTTTNFFVINQTLSILLLDAILGFILIILNFLVFIEIIRILKNKRNLHSNDRRTTVNMEKTKRTMIIMMFVGSANNR